MSISLNPPERPASEIAAQLSCWSGPVEPRPLTGGITNTNFVVTDNDDLFVVRVGHDQPLHGIVRSQEVAACRAASACGFSPEIIHSEPGALVMAYIDARTLSEQDVREPEILARIVGLMRRCHTEMEDHLGATAPTFWVFDVCRNYLSIVAGSACRLDYRLAGLQDRNERLEHAVGPVDQVFCHNDLLPANFLDDGDRLWLLDWEYAGWNTALFDLANLASNSQMNITQQNWLLDAYLAGAPTTEDLARFRILTCASLLREALWSMVQEQHSTLDFDFAAYTDNNMDRFDAAYESVPGTP